MRSKHEGGSNDAKGQRMQNQDRLRAAHSHLPFKVG